MASKPIREEDYELLKKEALRLKKYDYLKAITLLYYCGFRINETKQFSKLDIQKAIQNKILRAEVSKQRKDAEGGVKKKLYRDIPLSTNAVNDLTFVLTYCPSTHFIFPYKGDGLRVQVNRFIKKVLGPTTTSHGGRVGLIEHYITNNYDPRSVQKAIGHKRVVTTLNYFDLTWNRRVEMAESR